MTHSNGWSRTLRGMPREGAAAERSKTIGQQDIALFTELTGDRNLCTSTKTWLASRYSAA